MIARAILIGWLRLEANARGSGRKRFLRLLAFCLFLRPGEAAAQVGVVASVFTDDRFQGISVSDGRPVAVLDLSYDAPSGLYGSASGSLVATQDDGPKALGLVLNAGYARQLRPGLTADVGVLHSHYSHYSGLAGGHDYTEVYAGISGRLLGARLSVSPNYLGTALGTVRGEVNGHVSLTPKLSLEGQLGLLAPVGRGAYGPGPRVQADARIGVAQRLGRFALHAALTAATNRAAIYSGRKHSRTAFVIGISARL